MSWDGFQREVLAELGLQPWRHAPPADAAPTTANAGMAAAGEPPAAVEPAAAGVPRKLLEALARAAGCDVASVAALPGVEIACTGAAGKRALWPRLRRLRAARR